MSLPFIDRADAARQLAGQLAHRRGPRTVVLAIPRGAVPMGRQLADALGARLDLVLVHKLGAPGNPEYAIGAVDDGGWRRLTPEGALLDLDPQWLEAEVAAQRSLLQQRRRQWCGDRPRAPLKGDTAIVLDDGMATGATMQAALHAARARHPAWLVCAVPVASAEALQRVAPLADEVVCLATPEPFRSVGEHYRDFPQVEDAEVLAILQRPIRKPAE